MTTKKKNDSPNLLKGNALIISIGFNILLIAMFLVLYIPTLLPPPPPTPDPYQLTATELVRTATEGAMTEFPVIATVTSTSTYAPMPTLSAADEIALREQFLNELDTELGFLHPALEDTVDRLVTSIADEIEFRNEYFYSYNPMVDSVIYDIDRTIYDGDEYVAVVMPYWIASVVGTKGFVFRVRDGSPDLLAEAADGIHLERFADRNGNGFPDAALISNSGGSGSVDIMTFYEIRPNNGFIVLNSHLNANIQRFVDLNSDGIMELQGIQMLFVPEGVPDYFETIPRWFFWNGEAYEPYPTFVGE